jgi:hypothetical protein
MGYGKWNYYRVLISREKLLLPGGGSLQIYNLCYWVQKSAFPFAKALRHGKGTTKHPPIKCIPSAFCSRLLPLDNIRHLSLVPLVDIKKSSKVLTTWAGPCWPDENCHRVILLTTCTKYSNRTYIHTYIIALLRWNRDLTLAHMLFVTLTHSFFGNVHITHTSETLDGKTPEQLAW